MLDAIRRWFRREEQVVKEEAAGSLPVATGLSGNERETSTNAQVAGAADEPYPGNDDQ
jgi:hypothetical protein